MPPSQVSTCCQVFSRLPNLNRCPSRIRKATRTRTIATAPLSGSVPTMVSMSCPNCAVRPQRSLRTLFWRLQGQAAVLDGDEKLIRLSHRPAQMFRPASDVGEHQDLAATETVRFHELFQQLGQWESTLPTVPLWGSSPYWIGQSAKQYDELDARPEPE